MLTLSSLLPRAVVGRHSACPWRDHADDGNDGRKLLHETVTASGEARPCLRASGTVMKWERQ